jgi:predicted branched-subunit amino acid permease
VPCRRGPAPRLAAGVKPVPPSLFQEVPIARRFAASLRTGAASALVLLPSIVLYGIGFGIMAGTVQLSLAEAAFFSGVVYAGGAQLASLQGWSYPVPLLIVCLATVAINSRYLLMGATLRPFLAGHRPLAVYASLFFLVDANWAPALRQNRDEVDGVAFFLGSGLVMWGTWVASTMAGHGFGQILGEPRALGVDFVLAAFFTTAAVTFWRKAKTVLPLFVAAAVAVLAERLLHGPWYILIGALAGSLAGAWRR